MSGYTIQNLKQVEDQAPNFGLSPQLEARSATHEAHSPTKAYASRQAAGRAPAGATSFVLRARCGITVPGLAPNFRVPFGHKHKNQEEVYLVVSGSMRAKLEDEIVELGQWDALRVHKDTTRSFEAGPEGVEVIAVGAPNTGPGDAEVEQDWWSD